MNFRKFNFIFCIIVSVFLFSSGILILGVINSNEEEIPASVNQLITPFKAIREPVNVLVLGGDKVNKNTDTMMVVNFDPTDAKLNILSIPRDTKVSVKGSNVPKINSAFPAGGPKLAVKTVSNLLNINIMYYVYIDTSAFRKIIDLLGGVDFYVPADMDYDDPIQNLHIHLKKGQQRLNGAKAEQFMRFRQPSKSNSEIKKYYDGSDLKRIDAQQAFIKELIRQKTSVYYITKLNSLISVAFKNIETNMKLDEALKLSTNISKLQMSGIQMFKLPGIDSRESSGWYYVIDTKQASEIVKQNFGAKGEFIDNVGSSDSKNSSAGKKSTITKSQTKGGAKANGEADTKQNVTKGNPSNSETSIEGTSKDNP